MPTPLPLVSVLIPCYNYGHFLAEAVDSALNQTYPNMEILVLDDASTDNTRQVAESYGNRIRYFALPHSGQPATLNTGLDQAHGEYFVCLDADNLLKPDFVEKTLACLSSCRDPSVAFVYTARQLFGTRNEVVHPPAYDLARLKLRNFIDICVLARASDFRTVRYCVEKNLAVSLDLDFFLSLAEQGKGGMLLDEPLTCYRIHGESFTSRATQRYHHVKNIQAVIQRHPALYSHLEKSAAIAEARNRVRLAIIHNRRPGRPFTARLIDLGYLVATRPAFNQLQDQFRYTLMGTAPLPS
jgi:glycosyltransferase involved in cell wall biosynthesis